MATKRVKILYGSTDVSFTVYAMPVDDCFAALPADDIIYRMALDPEKFTLVHVPTGLIAAQAESQHELERFVEMLKTTDIDWSQTDISYYHSADVLEKSRSVRQQWLNDAEASE